MAENKTKPTRVDPSAFIAGVESEQRRRDALELVALMREITREPPQMWGPTIVGFGTCHYKYESGREGDVPLIGFSPRKANLVLYLGAIIHDDALAGKLGKHKTGKGCLYINKLDDVDRGVLRELVANAVATARRTSASARAR